MGDVGVCLSPDCLRKLFSLAKISFGCKGRFDGRHCQFTLGVLVGAFPACMCMHARFM